MPFYNKMGKIPPKRHTVFKSPADAFYYEQLFGTIGFDGMSSLLYHTHPPTMVKNIVKSYNVAPEIAEEKNMRSVSLKGFDIKPEDDYLESRKAVLVNSDVAIELAAPKKSLTEY